MPTNGLCTSLDEFMEGVDKATIGMEAGGVGLEKPLHLLSR